MVAQTKSEQFANRLNHLLDTMNAPAKNLGRARWFHDFIKKELKIDVTYEAARKWLSGESIPYIKRIGVIAKGLNSSVEYLIGEVQNNKEFYSPAEGEMRVLGNTVDEAARPNMPWNPPYRTQHG